ncbi:MAG: putative rane protein, partial [Candidatus Parcubacteria bacterium]
FAVLLLIGTVLFGVGYQLTSRGDDTNTDVTLITVGALYYLTLIWLFFHTLLGDQLGTAVSLVTYTVIGLGLYIGGIKTSDEYARLFGAMIVGGVVVRLMLIDIWELELIFRIVAFFVIGVLLLGTAFIKKQR